MTIPSKAPVHLGAMHHVAFRCRDAEQTRWFYEDVLGLPAASALVLDEVPGSGDANPYMHIFFELADGNYVAFFDAPGDADPAWFDRKDSFDMHFAMQVESEKELIAMRDRIRSFGINCGGPLDHHFVRSIYMYDPNGIQVEVTIRTPEHDTIMADEKAKLPELLREWSERTRTAKLEKFGAEALDMRAAAPRKA